MHFTTSSLSEISPRAYPYFLTEDGSPGFVVKVLPTGKLNFHFKKKVKGQRIVVALGDDLDTARCRYQALREREDNLRSKHKDALAFATGAIYFAPATKPAVDASQETVDSPLFYRGVTFDLLVKRFTAEHIIPNLKPNTAHNYVGYLAKVKRELGATMLINGNMSVADARQLLKSYINGMKQATPTQANRIRETLSSCFKWGIYEDLCHLSPIYGIRVFQQKSKTRRFSQGEISEFFKVLNANTFSSRTADCLKLILATGLRASEALGIKAGDVDLEGGKLLIPETKNGSSFIVPLVPLTRQLLSRSMEGVSKDGRLFKTSVFGLRQVTKRACLRAGITPCSTHDLRRTFGTLLGELGVSIHVISRCLNHSTKGNVTTRVYALYDMLGEKREALQKMAERLIALGCLGEDLLPGSELRQVPESTHPRSDSIAT